MISGFEPISGNMDDLREIAALGKELGYTGANLQQYVDKEVARLDKKRQQEAEREERLDKRRQQEAELDRNREKEREQFEREKQEKELEMLKIKASMAEKEAAKAPSTPVSPPPSSFKMPAFEEGRDKMDAYLERFERYATGEKWDRSMWAIRLSALLKARSLDIFSRLPEEQALDYDKLKIALLQSYQMTEDGYRVRFRTNKPEKNETPTQFASRNKSYFENWVKLSKIPKNYDKLVDLFLREQFMNSCSKECSVYLKERDCNTMEDMCNHAEKFVEAHGLHRFTFTQSKPFSSNRQNGKYAAKQTSATDSTESSKHKPYGSNGTKGSSGPLKCFNCGQVGHRSYQCKEPKRSKPQGQATAMSLVDQQQAMLEAMKEMTAAFKSSSKPEVSACLPVETSKVSQDPEVNLLNLTCNATVGEPRSHYQVCQLVRAWYLVLRSQY